MAVWAEKDNSYIVRCCMCGVERALIFVEDSELAAAEEAVLRAAGYVIGEIAGFETQEVTMMSSPFIEYIRGAPIIREKRA